MVTESDIVYGLRALGLSSSSVVLVHSSLRSFGNVEGGAYTVCHALLSTGATLLLPAGSWDMTGIPAPPGLLRPHNAVRAASIWQAFDEAVSCAMPFSDHLPIDKELGIIPETMRRTFPHLRSRHPLMSYIALGTHAQPLIEAQRLDWPLGPLEALAEQKVMCSCWASHIPPIPLFISLNNIWVALASIDMLKSPIRCGWNCLTFPVRAIGLMTSSQHYARQHRKS